MLYASAPTKESLLNAIHRFYGGTQMRILHNGRIQRVSDNKVLDRVIARQKGKRWRFETYEPPAPCPTWTTENGCICEPECGGKP